MKNSCTILAIFLMVVGCSPSKKVAPKHKTAMLTNKDILKGGTSFSDPIVIIMTTEREALDEEYRWLSINYPGFALGRRRREVRAPKQYDIVSIKIKDGRLRDIYFDITRSVAGGQ